MPTVLFIVAQHGFRDEELFDTQEVLLDAGCTCSVASITSSSASGKLGAMIHPDLTVKEALTKNYDVVIVVGGPGAVDLVNHQDVLALVKKQFRSGKIITAICIGPTILAVAGILNNKKATVWSSATDTQPIAILKKYSAIYVDKAVVADGNVITANGPEAATSFGIAIKRTLGL